MRRRHMVDIETPITVLALALPLLVTALALWLPAFALGWQQPTGVTAATPSALALPLTTPQPTPANATPLATPTATAGQAVTATPTTEPKTTTGPKARNGPRSTLPPTATQAGLTHVRIDYATSAGLLLLGGLGLALLLPGRRRATALECRPQAPK
jgi:hypothetical protein